MKPVEIYDNPLVNKIQNEIALRIQMQPQVQRRVNSLASTAGYLLQAANLGVFAAGGTSTTAAITIGVLIALAEIVVQATAKNTITPSGEALINDAIATAVESDKVAHVAEEASTDTV